MAAVGRGWRRVNPPPIPTLRTQVVLNNLFLKTGLQTTFSGNFLALIRGGTSPGRFTLKEALTEFKDFRFEVVRRRAR